jgi:glucokinase
VLIPHSLSEAVANTVPALCAEYIEKINMGESVSNGPIAIIGPGAGLAESFLIWDGSEYVTHGSERGHSDFAPTDERQIRLLHHLLPRFGQMGVERE